MNQNSVQIKARLSVDINDCDVMPSKNWGVINQQRRGVGIAMFENANAVGADRHPSAGRAGWACPTKIRKNCIPLARSTIQPTRRFRSRSAAGCRVSPKFDGIAVLDIRERWNAIRGAGTDTIEAEGLANLSGRE